MINLNEILDFIMQNNGAQIPLLQSKFGLSYTAAKSIVDGLVEDGRLFYLSGVDYTCDGEACGLETPVAVDEDEDDFGLYEEDDDEDDDETDERFAEYEKYLREQLNDDEEEDEEDKEDEDEGDDNDDFDEILERFMKRQEEFMAQLKGSARELVNVLCAIRDIKSAPVKAGEAPDCSLWKDEEEFVEAVRERLERLVKSDGKMDLQGAIGKAECWLEAVRDTHDRKMVQVYEWLVYEIKNHDNLSYEFLKKRFFG